MTIPISNENVFYICTSVIICVVLVFFTMAVNNIGELSAERAIVSSCEQISIVIINDIVYDCVPRNDYE